jgi:cytochrome c biogenesis protein CcmG, thiol:disulfide interchange protein DsbE
MQKRTWIVVGVIALVVVIAGAIAFASGGDNGSGGSAGTATSAGTGTGATSGASPVETAPVSVQGQPLPRFTGPTGTDRAIGDTIPTLTGQGFDGGPVTVAPTGTPQVLLFVAHWCPHCQAEVPRIVTLAKEKAFKGIDVSTVATGTSSNYPNYPPSVWLEREHWPFQVMVDSPQQTAAIAYGLNAYPYFVFVDAQGKVVGRANGEIAPSDLRKILTALAAGKPLSISANGASSTAS